MSSVCLRQQSTETLLRQYNLTRDPRLRDVIILRHESLVRGLAHRFLRPGIPLDDLVQSAWVALISAVDRYDPSFDTKFTTYAMHCMVGEIKRYFRDRTWGIKVPRQLQEIAANLKRVEDALYRELQRPPTVADLAKAFNVSEEDLLGAIEMYRAYQPYRLDDRHEMEDGTDSMALGEMIGAPDRDMEAVVEHAPLLRAISTLDSRRQMILRRRFFEGRSQEEVAEELAVSQMHVSRLERSALRQLRIILAGPDYPERSSAARSVKPAAYAEAS